MKFKIDFYGQKHLNVLGKIPITIPAYEPLNAKVASLLLSNGGAQKRQMPCDKF